MFEFTENTEYATIIQLAQRACAKVPPLWPLTNFVAVNPYQGFVHQSVTNTAHELQRVWGTSLFLPQTGYNALNDATTSKPYAANAAAVNKDQVRQEPRWRSMAELADKLYLNHAPVHEKLNNNIASFLAAYVDAGQAIWPFPWRHLPLYHAFFAAAKYDRSMELAGLPGFRAFMDKIAAQPPEQVIAQGVLQLGIQPSLQEEYLLSRFCGIMGWAGHLRYRVHQANLAGENNSDLISLLAIRVACDLAVFALHPKASQLQEAWSEHLATMGQAISAASKAHVETLVSWQKSLEHDYRQQLLQALQSHKPDTAQASRAARPQAQAVFCIDVRSEVFRRHLETVAPKVETIGFAGFFGFAIQYQEANNDPTSQRCPVLISPALKTAAAKPGTPLVSNKTLEANTPKRQLAATWDTFKNQALSCFNYIESLGTTALLKLFRLSLPAKKHAQVHWQSIKTTLAILPENHETDADVINQLADIAASALNGMSLKHRPLARLVLLCGHRGVSNNNPHASSLDCGACGGHSGEMNARLAARLFNNPSIRQHLLSKDINIPDDTLFVAGLHNTTLDEITLFEDDPISAEHRADLALFTEQLTQACIATRIERAQRLGDIGHAPTQKALAQRGVDASEVRPEWALAGNAAFIVGNREHSRRLNLQGRTFLHSYDADTDADGQLLTVIMTAPMVVASWINLQYYASTVDPQQMGAGTKTLHNVVGTLGVSEGNGFDLRAGLPLQSVYDPQGYVHNPIRLQVFIEAPRSRIEAILKDHKVVRDLIENNWITLVAINQADKRAYRYMNNNQWHEESFAT